LKAGLNRPVQKSGCELAGPGPLPGFWPGHLDPGGAGRPAFPAAPKPEAAVAACHLLVEAASRAQSGPGRVGEKVTVCVAFLRCAAGGEAGEWLPLGKSVQFCAYLHFAHGSRSALAAARLSESDG
jgi:hypothetical protein